MLSLFIALGATGTVIVLIETVLWRIFLNKMAPLDFPLESDTAFFRFFKLKRIRLLMFIHTAFMIVITFALLLWLW